MIRSGKVRRAKLYYLRDRTGKSARIAEKIKKKIGIDIVAQPADSNKPIVAKTEETLKESKKETPEKIKAESKENK